MKIYDVRGIGASLTGSFSGSFKGLFTGPLDGVAATSSYVQYSNVANKPALVSGSSQVSFSGITNKPTLISGSAQIAAFGYATTGSNTFINDQTITGSLAINDSATNFLIEGNIFSQTYLTSNGAIVLNPGYGGVEVVGSYKELRLNDIYANGFVSGEIRANNGVVSGSSQVLGFNVFATTGSNQFNGNQSITGSLTVSGQVIAQTLNVQQVTSSIVFSSGSNRFGNTLGNTHSFTGSVNITGSLTVNGVSASFSEYVPYTGATAEVNLGTNSMYSSMVYINGDGTGGGGVLNLKKGSTRVIGGNDAANTVSLWSDTAAFGFNDWVSANVRSAKFSLASISNNQTRTYTLPNETGTLALTSNLSSYLPLAGGTLTGALNGTSATFSQSANSYALKLLNNAGYPSIIDLSTTTATSTARNWSIYTNGTNWGDLEFKPSAANGGDPYTTGTVALRLASTGAATFSSSVNVGNAGAGSTFNVKGGASNSQLEIGNLANGTNYILSYDRVASTYKNFLITTNASDNALFINTTGSIGIGTTSPEALLHLSQAATGGNGAFIFIDNPASSTLGNTAGIRFATNAGASFSGYGSSIEAVNTNNSDGAEALTFSTWNGASRGERMRITSEGYLGTTVTSTTVSAGDLLGVLSFVSKDSSTYSSGGITNIRSYATTTYNTGNVSGDLRFYVSNGLQNTTGTYLFGTEAMRITSGGNVGIDRTNPLAKLSVYGGAFQLMGDYANHQTIIKNAAAQGTLNGSLTITVPDMAGAGVSIGYGGFSCEVYVAGFEAMYCHAWFSGYTNNGVTPSETAILRSSGGWSVSQFGNGSQGLTFVIDYPASIIHPTARIIINKGGHAYENEYPANSITTVWT